MDGGHLGHAGLSHDRVVQMLPAPTDLDDIGTSFNEGLDPFAVTTLPPTTGTSGHPFLIVRTASTTPRACAVSIARRSTPACDASVCSAVSTPQLPQLAGDRPGRGSVRVLDPLVDVLHRDQALQHTGLVDQRKLLDAMLVQHRHRFLARAHGR